MHFVETIKIKDGTVMALPYHQTRMERTVDASFPALPFMTCPASAKSLTQRQAKEY